jgi:primosomal protein N' (replication factor Y)
LVVIDEEHEPSYKQEASPRYHARETAIQLGRLARVPVLLSSATPDIVSYYRAEQEEYRLLSLPDRVGDTRQGQVVRVPLPDVEVVDMRREARAGNVGLISRSLLDHLERTLDHGLQALLFLNRRGAATALTCRSCGRAVECRRCSIAMGYHESRELLICHRCGRTREAPTTCPQCSERLSALGAGVQKVESEVRKKLPSARVIRWDRDTTSKRGSHEAIWRSFSEHDADVLIGTQMIGKGLDFPDVGLVGIVLAESQLFLPDYRAAERTFEILTQVAGRTGRRSDRVGQVVLQTYVPGHYVIRAAARQDYLDLYRRELAFRRQQAYPPFRPLIRLVFSASNAGKAQDEAARVGRLLLDEAARLGLPDVQIIGPAPSFIVRLRGRYRWHIVMAGSDASHVLDAVTLGPGWIVDVDPMDTL